MYILKAFSILFAQKVAQMRQKFSLELTILKESAAAIDLDLPHLRISSS